MKEAIENAETDIWLKTFRKNADVVSRKIAGEVILVPVRGNLADMNRIFALDGVGEFIWQALDEGKNLGEIRNELLDRFDVEKATADTDVREFIHELVKADLIRE
jgi:Coenzyme PQQ synthesis protein D (PqqD)